MMLDASPAWQNAFVVAVLVAMGWCVWNGWRTGLVRALVSMAGLLVGCAAGIFSGIILGAIVGTVLPVVGGMIGLVGGTAVGLGVYSAIWFLGALLFKRTSQQRTMLLRWSYGLGGALIGAFVGISVLWGALLFVRGMGGVCAGTVEATDGFYGLPVPLPVARALVKLKNSVEAGSTGKFLQSLDPMPPEYYRIFEKSGRLIADPRAMRRLLAFPGVQEVLVDLHFIQLTKDSEVQALGRSQNGTALLHHPKILEAVNDPVLIAKLQKIDIEKALDFALAGPTPHPAPHPTKP